MGALDVKLGEILEQGRNLSASVQELKRSVTSDHDTLVVWTRTIEEDRKNYYNRLKDLEELFRREEAGRNKVLGDFLKAQEEKEKVEAEARRIAAEKKVERQEKQEGDRRKRLWGIVMKVLGWGLMLLGAYLMSKLGIHH